MVHSLSQCCELDMTLNDIIKSMLQRDGIEHRNFCWEINMDGQLMFGLLVASLENYQMDSHYFQESQKLIS